MKALELPSAADLGRLYSGFYDDFYGPAIVTPAVGGSVWDLHASDSGTAAPVAGIGGVMRISASDGSTGDNDETYIHTPECYNFVNGQPIIVEAEFLYTEKNTDDANVMFGLMDAIGANKLLDDGGGPAASYAGAVFFKTDGATTWSVENSDGGTQKTTNLDGTQAYSQGANMTGEAQTAGGGSTERLRIEWRPKTSTKADVLFWKDEVLVAKHVDQTYASATEMSLVLGVKNGDTTGVGEVVDVDYIFGYQKRA